MEDLKLGVVFESQVRDLHIIGVDGREWIGKPFEIDLLLVRLNGALTIAEIEEIVGRRAAIALGAHAGDRFHGTIVSVEHLDGSSRSVQRYVARLVPDLSLLTLGRRSAIYQDMTVPELVTAVLSSYGMTAGSDFELRVTGASTTPKHEYIVQYQESDWDFMARWLEHEGFFSFFEHGEEGAVFVVADDNADAPKLKDPGSLSYRPRNQMSSGAIPTVWDVRVRERHVPRAVTVVDYNYRRPERPVGASAEVRKTGFGHVALYGEHPKDDTEAAAIATLRAQELAAERRVLAGTTDCGRFRVAHRFTLENHHVPEYDGEYLITSVRHRAGTAVNAPDDETPRKYWAEFEATPAAIPYRPSRQTAWPSIHGVMHGHVQSDGSGETAEIDELGRYKVRLPFDVGSKKGLAASRWIRKAQSYAGPGYGMHFPLHKGVEVLIAHVDGDPDRPIIVGSVPHASTPSPVNRANATQSVIQTASGIRVELEDLQG